MNALTQLSFPAEVTFVCRALDDARLGLPVPVQLDPTLTVHPHPPVDLDATWQHWLGSIQTGHFKKSQFVIVAQIQNPVLEDQAERLVQAFHCGLLLQGYAYCSGGLKVDGNTDRGHLHIGPIGPVFPHFAILRRRLPAPTQDRLHEAYKLAQSIIKVFEYPRRFMRLRRSFSSWYRGIRNGEISGERLHSFVRAVEGLTQPPRYRMTASFVSRGHLFIGGRKRNEALLRQLYTLRSCMEHVQLWRHELKKVRGLNAEQSFLFRALQAELLASAALMKILHSPVLLRYFGTEKMIARFWALPDADRRKLWGKPFALDKEAKRLYQAS